MRTRRLGSSGPLVSEVALGCMAFSSVYGGADRAESIATVRAALDRGVTLLDTGDFYGMGHNELLLREAVAGRKRETYAVSVKFGSLRGPDGTMLGVDARPEAVKTFLAYSLRRLDTDYVDVYRPARVDPDVPIEETVGAIAELVESGHVRHIGLSEVGADTILRATAVAPIVDVQLEYSLLSRGVEGEILATCREHGVGVTAYGVLSRGLLGGGWSGRRQASPGDIRGRFPRFRAENLEQNLALVESLRRLAEARGATVSQLAIAWVLSRGADIEPLLGARTREQLADGLGALELELSPDELAAIEEAVPPGAAAGGRYDERQLAQLDSER